MEFEMYCQFCGRLIKVIERKDNYDGTINKRKCCCAYCGVELFDENESKNFYIIEWDD